MTFIIHRPSFITHRPHHSSLITKYYQPQIRMTNIQQHLSKDPILAKAVAIIELPDIQSSEDIYYSLLDSIVSQQLSVKVADVIFKRFLGLFDGGYPEANILINLDPETMRSVGLSYQKAGYLKNVAEFFIKENLENKDWDSFTDDELVDYLSQIKGVGKWTVQMILMFTLKRLDVMPIDDLGIQQGMMLLYGLEKDKALKTNMLTIAEAWQPYRSEACRYIWRYKDAEK
jgi:DNA-3-methyladenine glycosylase II